VRRTALAWAALATLGAAGPLAASDAGAGAAPERFDTVVIDAGHGGEDTGARGRGLVEKELVLDVSRRLAEALRAEGLRVVMTRTRDEFVPLETRTARANDARGDLFVSIHANAAPSRKARGIEAYFLSLETSDDDARQVVARENAAFESAAPAAAALDDPLVAILGDLIATEHLRDSDEFARLAEARLAGLRRVHSRGVKQAPFVVLMGVQMPAALVEIGFLTNPDEERSLARADHREVLVAALRDAIVEFGRRHDDRRGVARKSSVLRGGAAPRP